ncbi:Rv1355c family protein [Nocardia yunnanensis]|uniref:Rv1355c family protein n=1 Tax=Nocardia yunnanensis TaxID=2382165 RepID=A0A386Z5L3_9NOCA|nr:Rv1355c family protein [Nocardia yunnanensis]AYF72951.1 Rv1355c family protein [Nocardia yunnanensis]
MSGEPVASDVHRPRFLDESDPDDAAVLARLRADPRIEFRDLRPALRAEFATLLAPPDLVQGAEADRWVYYPWRASVVGLPGPELFRAVRLDRNRNKLTRAEQTELANQTIGVIGQSVGHAIAHTLALEGICGRIRLADFDAVELSNLNRLPGTLFDIGINKAVVSARRIAELDPYLPVEVFADGLNDDNMDRFLDGISIVVEVCDSLDIKLAVREAARRRRVPLLMETSDRGLLDVERYDLEPERRPFHGLMGEVTTAELRGLSTREKSVYGVRIVDGSRLSEGMAASLMEIGRTVNSWPQLGGDVQLGGATVAAAVRRIGLGRELPSGQTRVDLEDRLNEVAEPAPPALVWPADPIPEPVPVTGVPALLAAAQRAPSGGNAQPWTLRADADSITIELAPERSTLMDIGHRASALAVGAALYNARAAAAALGLLGDTDVRSDAAVPLTATLRIGSAHDAELAADYPALLDRHTNRRRGDGAPVSPHVLGALGAAASGAGGGLRALTDRADIEAAAAIIAESDRIRYLTPGLHAEMFAELRWPGDDLDSGLDLRTLELAPGELDKLFVVRRPEVMSRVRAFDGGAALGEPTRAQLLTASALVAVTFPTPRQESAELGAYARAGAALERVWIEAQRHELGVHPVSPVFLFARHHEELKKVSPEFADTLTSLQGRFLNLLGVPADETVALVLRLSHAPDATYRSGRLPVPEIDLRG